MNLRTLLVLGRVSNLPTVWSNLLVGWILADVRPKGGFISKSGPDGTLWPVLSVLLGGSLLYIGGMYLNDYCDTVFDARYCPERPIPAGTISRRIVGLLAVLWFAAGFACFTSFGPATIGFTLFLITAIVAYDFHHKDVAWAPLLMGVCRCLLYLLAASAVNESWYFCPPYGNWWPSFLRYLWDDCWVQAQQVVRYLLPAALPLGLYVAGITYVARGESRPGKPARWAYLLLFLAFIMLLLPCYTMIQYLNRAYFPHPHEYLLTMAQMLTPCLLLPAWTAWLLIPFWRKTRPSIGRVVSGLLAGIVLLDMIVVAPQVGLHAFELLPLFLIALLLQRVIPAT